MVDKFLFSKQETRRQQLAEAAEKRQKEVRYWCLTIIVIVVIDFKCKISTLL